MFGSAPSLMRWTGKRRPRLAAPGARRLHPSQEFALEPRITPSTLTLSGSDVSYVADAGETNDLRIAHVTQSGSSYIQFDERGAGVSITSVGSGLIAQGTAVLVPAASVNSIDVQLDDGNDLLKVTMGGLPATITADGGTAADTTDALTVLGTSGNDAVTLAPDRDADGLRTVDLIDNSTTLSFLGMEHLTLDLSQNGEDNIGIDRYITSIDQPLSVNIVGGGTGHDNLVVTSPGDVPQTATISDGSVRIDEAKGGTETFLGRSDNIAIDQPKAQIEVSDETNPNNPIDFGPTYFNTFLLDTGASGIVAAADATGEMEDNGYQTQGQYNEQGVAGFTAMDVSKAYTVYVAGDSGIPHVLNNFRIESSEELNFSFLGPWGIIGMPAMVNHVVNIDMTGWGTDLSDPADLEIHTDFSDTTPPNSGHLRHVPLDLIDFPVNGTVFGAPPSFAPLPHLNVVYQDNGHTYGGQVLLDTGAQLSIISTRTAIALGLDKNHNGTLDDEALDTIEVGGIGGTTTIPMVAIDRAEVPTEEGDSLVWTQLVVGVLDIDVVDADGNTLSLAGVFGMDFLTSGWANKILPPLLGEQGSDENGYFDHIYFDFRDAIDHKGTLIFDVDPSHDHAATRNENSLSITHTGLDTVSVQTGAGDDTFNVTPSTTQPISVDGGPHIGGDALNVVPSNLAAMDHGTYISVAGYQDIQYQNIEIVNGQNNNGNGTPDIHMMGVTTDGQSDLTLTYEVTGGAVSPFAIGIYRSNDTVYDSKDTSIASISISDPSDLTVGTHVLHFTIGNQAGQVRLPGGGMNDTSLEQRLIVVADPADAVPEDDANPTGEDNTVVFSGVYHVPGGDVIVYGTEAADTLTVSASGGSLTVNLNGNAYSYPTSEVATIRARLFAGNDTLNASTSPRALWVLAGDGNDSLAGGTASDTFSGGAGNDTFNGGGGSDWIAEKADVNFSLTNTSLGGLGTDSLTSIEHADLTGGPQANTLDASAFTLGGVKLNGFGGNDTLLGGTQSDSLTGGPGSDLLQGNGGTDRVVEMLVSAGTLVVADGSLTGSLGTDTLVSIERAVLTGSGGADTLDASAFTLGPVTLDGAGGNDTLIGSRNSDSIIGGPGNDSISAGDGNDIISGGKGDDAIDAGSGNDELTERFDGTQILTDTSLVTAFGTDTLSGIARVWLQGGRGNDTLDASGFTLGPVTLFGGGGDDTIRGGAQNDVLFGGDGSDSIDGGAGNDALIGWRGDDTLLGGSGRDLLSGGRDHHHADELHGGDGEDILISGGTSYDLSFGVLNNLIAEWSRTDEDYTTRLSNLISGGGLNGSAKLDSSTVTVDSVIESIYGDADRDWFLVESVDITADYEPSETKTLF